MSRIAVITDSNSGITQQQAADLKIQVVPMPFFINEKMYLEGITLNQEEFYNYLSEDADIHTSQPSPADVMDIWNETLKNYDQIVYIPMSSGLSASCETAMALARDYEGKVFVVNNQRISVTQRQSALDALKLVEAGYSAAEIKDVLEKEKKNASIYLMVETLKYLKKGGRITPTAAALGTVLNLKPVLQIQGEKLDAYAKARGKEKAKSIMLNAIREDLTGRFREEFGHNQMVLQSAYAGNYQEAMEWKKQIEDTLQMPVHMDPLSLSVACHVGPGVLAVTCTKVL